MSDDTTKPRLATVQRAASSTADRRRFLRGSFFAGLGLTSLLAGVEGWNFLWPRKIGGFGGPIDIPPEKVPRPGDAPVRFVQGKFWLVHLRPGEGAFQQFGLPGEGGLLALWQRCPHLGCTVPWQPAYEYKGVTSWFRCPCHGSTYTPAGIRVHGPATRSMDTMRIDVRDDGWITVQTGEITNGDVDNAVRAVPYGAGAG